MGVRPVGSVAIAALSRCRAPGSPAPTTEVCCAPIGGLSNLQGTAGGDGKADGVSGRLPLAATGLRGQAGGA